LKKLKVSEDGVEGKVGYTHDPFEDSKEKLRIQ